ncbi:MAG TPA: DUF1801 domain-containing protein [Candidatus Thermoplasmatota archaeon]|nr:DUF1801 domain-containing protein [Candidatus Thermoplasmatota archaeon]
MASAPAPWNIRADPAAVRAYYAALPLPVRLTAKTLDALARDALPGVRTGIKWSVPFYYLKGPVCYVSAAKRHVTFGLVQGAEVPDASGRLTGTGKSPIRKATFPVDEEVPAALVRRWLREARKLDPLWGTD